MLKSKNLLLIAFIAFVLIIFQRVNIADNVYESNKFKGEVISKYLRYLKTSSGEKIQFAQNNKGYYILSFISSWCELCNKQMQGLKIAKAKYNIPIYAVMLYEEGVDKIDITNPEYNFYSDILIDENRNLSNYLQIFAVPTTLLINSKNQIVSYVVGMMDDKSIAKYFSKYIGGASSS